MREIHKIKSKVKYEVFHTTPYLYEPTWQYRSKKIKESDLEKNSVTKRTHRIKFIVQGRKWNTNDDNPK